MLVSSVALEDSQVQPMSMQSKSTAGSKWFWSEDYKIPRLFDQKTIISDWTRDSWRGTYTAESLSPTGR